MSRPLLEIQDIYKTYGKQAVLSGVRVVVGEGEKIALIGRNGAGKTTLMRIALGQEEADRGTVRFLPAARVGSVAQNEVLPETGTVLSYWQSRAEKPVWDIRKLAKRFALEGDMLERVPRALSGGEQMRVKLVAMLLADPNMLLLDEPVNYLDLPTLILLERFLCDFSGSVLLIAHDRELLQNTCTTTWELEHGSLTTYRGPVNAYLDWKEEQKEFARRTNKRLAKEIAHQQEFVDRFLYKASLASRAQSKVKHIERLRRQLLDVRLDVARVRMHIPCPIVPKTVMLRTKDLAIGYGEHALAQGIELEVMQGEKVLIAGENGRGKSTLLKTLAGTVPPVHGQVKWWHKVALGYYAQHTEAVLKETDTVLDHLHRCAPEGASGEAILRMAGTFLFRDDDLEKRVSVLSGGERSRLALAGVLLEERSVLILDEPTNHLDMETVESLAVALRAYVGTVLFVSHARTFAHTIATRIVEVRAGALRAYNGSYDDYVGELVERAEEDSADAAAPTVNHEKAARTQERLRVRELERAQARLEKRLAELDTERSALLAFFFENPTDYSPEKTERLAVLDAERAKVEREWLKAEEEKGE